ncbi:hypothetical protein SAMN05216603_12030 [Pseudomonas benzenivorans]|nr:hypothetical protein [Pseudomonas benzenivorans]SDI06261.1 hypothetical protein SAMN05216603_12030 [Pseudomonas benzenivorans]
MNLSLPVQLLLGMALAALLHGGVRSWTGASSLRGSGFSREAPFAAKAAPTKVLA